MKLSTIILLLITAQLAYAKPSAKEMNLLQAPLVSKEVALILNSDGTYYPQTIHLHEGEKATLWIMNTQKQSSCFSIPEKNILLTLYPLKLSSLNIQFNKTGIYRFNCPGSTPKQSGEFVISTLVKERIPASITTPMILPANLKKIHKKSSFQNILYPNPSTPWSPKEHNLEEEFFNKN
ncbi:MAG: cupredoxin domain-containing protein [Oligoflexia bacterium]|nr:cupredoxin domain-containing protein [Oligoflexia bacterium]MBF0364888.1 cupredoxin domain-containing protein [Oligoflexia bacterium]